MTRSIVDTIENKMKELQKNLILLKTTAQYINKENLKQDMLRYWGIERGIQICIECVIDIANIIVSSLDIEKSDTYRETIIALSKKEVLPQKFAKEIANMVSFRNILVHDYMKVDEDIMMDILKNHLEDFIKYMNYINKWIKNNYY